MLPTLLLLGCYTHPEPQAPGYLPLEGGSIHKRVGRRTNPEKDSHSPLYRWDPEAQRWGVTSPRPQS